MKKRIFLIVCLLAALNIYAQEYVLKKSINGKFGYVDQSGNIVVPFVHKKASSAYKAATKTIAKEKLAKLEKETRKTINNSFAIFENYYVESKINTWQKKGESETYDEWQERVNVETRKEMSQQYAKEAERLYIAEQTKKYPPLNLTLGQYDAENETFLISDKISKNEMILFVPREKALYFKESWAQIVPLSQYVIDNSEIVFTGIDFLLPQGDIYKYKTDESLSYSVGTSYLMLGSKSDVALNIHKTDLKNDKIFAVIIANENYQYESKVDFAYYDGETFKNYCIKTLGIPESNICFFIDATYSNFRTAINWLSDISEDMPNQANIIFYYAGHGISDGKNAYFLPVDGSNSDTRSGYKVNDFFSRIGTLQFKNVILFVDACFNGAQRNGKMFSTARGATTTAHEMKISSKMILFSASNSNETAFSYPEKQHGMFTYFLLKKLQETKGNVSLGEMNEYISENVKKQSQLIHKKIQTPTVTTSQELSDIWEKIKIIPN
ncbi:MAG: caspase family protein [Marinilabiliaceae bacterium]|nr:caspase family protein [Marinilabiliaceae bacterium]